MPGWLQKKQGSLQLSKFLVQVRRGNLDKWLSRGKHVIKFVQVPCPSSCPSSGSSPGEFSYPNIFFYTLTLAAEPLEHCAHLQLDPGPSPLCLPAWHGLQLCGVRVRGKQFQMKPNSVRLTPRFYHVFSSCRAKWRLFYPFEPAVGRPGAARARLANTLPQCPRRSSRTRESGSARAQP